MKNNGIKAQKATAIEGEYSKVKRIKNTILGAAKNPYNIIVVILLLMLGYLIILPLIEMIHSTFFVSFSDLRHIPGSYEGDFTLHHWRRVFNSPGTATAAPRQVSNRLMYTPFRNSLFLGINVASISVVLGSLMAWIMVRTDLPGKKLLSVMMIIPYMLPTWTISLMWLTVFRTGTRGGMPGFLAGMGLQVPNWLAYGPFPIIVVMSLSGFGSTYLLVSGALSSVNSEVEEMASIMGASKARLLRKITFPLVLPAMLSGFILSFASAMGSFSTPHLLGARVGYDTIATMLVSSIRNRNLSTGYIITIVLILIVAVAVFVNQKMIGLRRSYATIMGKGTRTTPLSLGKAKYPLFIFLAVFLTITVAIPMFVLMLDTVMLVPGVYSLSNFTLHYWIGARGGIDLFAGMPGVFRHPWFWQSFRTTMLLTVCVAVIGMFAGQFLGYVCTRGRGRLSGKILEQCAFLPYMIPSVTFGALYLEMWIEPRWIIPSLYGTFALLVLICVVNGLPSASRAGTANMMQIGYDLEEAASIQGASFIRRFRKIVLPLAKPGFLTGFILIFMSTITTLDLIILLMSSEVTTLSYMVFSFSESGESAHASVLSAFMFLLVLATYLISIKIGKVDLAAAYGGSSGGGKGK